MLALRRGADVTRVTLLSRFAMTRGVARERDLEGERVGERIQIEPEIETDRTRQEHKGIREEQRETDKGVWSERERKRTRQEHNGIREKQRETDIGVWSERETERTRQEHNGIREEQTEGSGLSLAH